MHDDERLLSVHPNIACDSCDAFPLVGIRYRCLAMDNTDMCEACYAKLVPQQRDLFEAIGFNKTKKEAEAEEQAAQSASASTETPREESSEPESEETKPLENE